MQQANKVPAGHTWYDTFGNLAKYGTAEYYCAGTWLSTYYVADALDFFNPLATPQDVIDVISYFSEESESDPAPSGVPSEMAEQEVIRHLESLGFVAN